MARYSEGDIVRITDFEVRDAGPIFEAVITEVLTDSTENESTYEIVEVGDDTSFWIVRDNNIHALLGNTFILYGNPEQGRRVADMADVRDKISAVDAQLAAQTAHLWRQTTRRGRDFVNPVEAVVEAILPGFNTLPLAPPAPTTPELPIPRQGETIEQNADGEIIVTTQRGERFVFSGIPHYNAWNQIRRPAVPVQNREEGRELQRAERTNITTTDYRPKTGNTRPLRTFVISMIGEDLILTPTLPFGSSVYQFFDQNGTQWDNEHNSLIVSRAETTLVDHCGQRWARMEDVEFARRGSFQDVKRTPKKKKHLRRRTPMPEIKDAKYYGSREFIG